MAFISTMTPMALLERDAAAEERLGLPRSRGQGERSPRLHRRRGGSRQDHLRRPCRRGRRPGGPRGDGRLRRLDHTGSAGPAARDAADPAGRRLAGRCRPGEVFLRLSDALGRPGTPYLLVIEDAHWADDATLDLVRHLARRVHRLRALVLVTFRAEEAVGNHRAPDPLRRRGRLVRRTTDRPEPAHPGRCARAARGGRRVRGRVRTRRRRALPHDRAVTRSSSPR